MSAGMFLFNPCLRYTSRTRPKTLQLLKPYTRPVSTSSVGARNTFPNSNTRLPPKVGGLDQANEQYRRVKLVENLYEKGLTTLYKAPRRLTYFRLQCWTIIGLGLSFVSWYFQEKLYNAEKLKNQGVEHPWLTTIGETATAGLVCLVIGSCAYRSTNHVQTIQLIKELDQVFVRISSRSAIPFVKSHVAIRPFNLAISDRLVMPKSPPKLLALKKLNETSVSALILSVMENTLRALPLVIWHIFNEARHFVLSDGFINVRIVGEDAKLRAASAGYYTLDMSGDWLLHKPEWAKKENLALYDIGRTQRF